MMEKPKEPKQEEPEERIAVGPLMFKPYQMHIMGVLSRAEGHESIEGWLQHIVLRDVLIPKLEFLSETFSNTMLAKLKRDDGYGR